VPVLVYEDDRCSIDAGEVGTDGSGDRIEAPLRPLRDTGSALSGARGLRWILLDDDDLPARELERPRVDAREAELEHPAGRLSGELENLRGCACSKRRRQPSHDPRR
jgi:hypothetical protein